MQKNEDMRQFHIGNILSITGKALVTPNGDMDGVYDILNFMTNDDLSTVQLPRAANECRPYLREQFPWTAGIDDSMVNRENWREWLAEQVIKYGEFHAVRRMHAEDHENLSIEEDVRRINPSAKVINFGADEDDIS